MLPCGIPPIMDQATGGTSLKRPKDPNFGAVVVASIVVLLLVFVAAWFLVMRHGRQMVPAVHPDHEPHASWLVPEHSTPPAQRRI
ncbi:MAG: hypothetical protein WBD32_21870 [Acidobacteriaceae bacterium]